MNSTDNSLSFGLQNKSSKSVRVKNTDEMCHLLVYGYASKLYRDDERAEELEKGKHLISWMGNENIKIDRYDVRGYLSDLTQFEKKFDFSMSVEEQQMENMCDIERYHALISNEEEEQEYKEEEAKRQNRSLAKEYHQVPFQYDSLMTEVNEESTGGRSCSENVHEATTPSIPASGSSTSNIKEIIRKTAKCVAEHGRQMEIIIKARQANNDKFNFLNHNNELNSYYECTLKEFKNRQTQNTVVVSEKDENNDTNVFKGDVTISSVESAPGKCNTSELQNCPYSLIVDSIQNLQKKCN